MPKINNLEMTNLKYRRHFLFSPIECKKLEGWQTEKVDNYFIYVHPDCKFEKSSGVNDLYLIGYFCDPHHETRSSQDILNNLSQLNNINDFPNKLYSLVGRFVLIIKTENDFIFFNDPCGFKTIYYTKDNDKFFAASQPLLIKEVVDLKQTRFYDDYFNSNYVAENIENWVPSGFTFYKNTYHLIPNHYIKISEPIQVRYYPFKEIELINYSELVIKFSNLLKKIVLAAHRNMDLTFTLTAGWDTRIILSCCKDYIDGMTFYTLKYRGMNAAHPDIKIPMLLSRTLKLNFDIYNCQKEITPEFSDVYKSNTDMAHIDDWGKIAFGMSKSYPDKKVAVKGVCSEVGRCFYYPNGKVNYTITINDLLNLESGWVELGFLQEEIRKWYLSLEKNCYNYNLYDLFYWEHRMGSWQAQSQLEWDIVQEVFTPFNSREIIDLMFSIEASKREKYHPQLYLDAIKYLWKETLRQPINPIDNKTKIKNTVIKILKKIGLLQGLKSIMKKIS
ncbi:MAG: hypothetical protein U0T76_14325 [Saprospiraceae bacterium]